MEIVIEMSDIPDGTGILTGFRYIWLRYVRDFRPWFHCARSLVSYLDNNFQKGMALPAKITLQEHREYKHIYLCGEASKEEDLGLHLAMLPEAGATFVHETYNHMTIRVTNARQLPIQKLLADYMGMPWAYVSCCNWQFGIQYYGTKGWKPQLPTVFIT